MRSCRLSPCQSLKKLCQRVNTDLQLAVWVGIADTLTFHDRDLPPQIIAGRVFQPMRVGQHVMPRILYEELLCYNTSVLMIF